MAEKSNSRNLIRAAAPVLMLMMAASFSEAAIVNSLTGFAEQDPGWSGNLGGSFAARGGNTEQSTFAADSRLQWYNGKETFRFIGSGKRTSSGGVETAQSLLGHVRHNHSLSPKWSTLAFFQAQENPFQRLESRLLLGLGLRWDALGNKTSRLAIGAAHMVEREQIEEMPGADVGHSADTGHRLSMFLNAGHQLREGITFQALAFFQPDWSDFEDFRLMVNADLDVKLAGNLSLFTGLELEGDTRPPANVEKYDWENKTGFRFKF